VTRQGRAVSCPRPAAGSGEELTRRRWLGRLSALLASAVTLPVLPVLARALLLPYRPAGRDWRTLGPAGGLPSSGFARYESEAETAGWMAASARRVVYVRRGGDGILALSARCSHLGCLVQWNGSDRRFHCPCHGGVYDEQGRVVSGPPPRPLTRLEAKLESGDLWIRPEEA